jgi:hypothetical protein
LYLFLNIIMQVWRNCQVLSGQTSDWSAFLNATCPIKYVLNCEQHFSYSNLDYLASILTVTILARGLLYIYLDLVLWSWGWYCVDQCFSAAGPSSYEKRIYRAAVSQRLRTTGVDDQNGGTSSASWPWFQLNGLSANCRSDHTHRRCSLVFPSVLGHTWPSEGSWRSSSAESWLTSCCI